MASKGELAARVVDLETRNSELEQKLTEALNAVEDLIAEREVLKSRPAVDALSLGEHSTPTMDAAIRALVRWTHQPERNWLSAAIDHLRRIELGYRRAS